MSKIYIKGEEVITKNNEPIASEETLGMVKVGNTLSKANDGTINVDSNTFYTKAQIDALISGIESSNIKFIQDNSEQNPFIWTAQEPGIYAFYDNTLGQLQSSIFMKYDAEDTVQQLFHTGYVMVIDVTVDDPFVANKPIGLIYDVTSNVIVSLTTQTGSYKIGHGTEQGLGIATVKTIDNQTINGVKTFVSSPIVPTPTNNTDAANKEYVDNSIGQAGGAAVYIPEEIFSLTTESTEEDILTAFGGSENLTQILEKLSNKVPAYTLHKEESSGPHGITYLMPTNYWYQDTYMGNMKTLLFEAIYTPGINVNNKNTRHYIALLYTGTWGVSKIALDEVLTGIASASALGGVKVGNYLEIDSATGKLSNNAPLPYKVAENTSLDSSFTSLANGIYKICNNKNLESSSWVNGILIATGQDPTQRINAASQLRIETTNGYDGTYHADLYYRFKDSWASWQTWKNIRLNFRDDSKAISNSTNWLIRTRDLSYYYGDKTIADLQTTNKSSLVDAINEVNTKAAPIQVTALPTASATLVGKIYQFIGTTTSTNIHGYFYECVDNGGTYSWVQTNVQPSSGGGGATLDDRYIDRDLFTTIFDTATYDTPTQINTQSILTHLYSILATADVNTKFYWGASDGTSYESVTTQYANLSINSSAKTLTLIFDYEGSATIELTVVYSIQGDSVTASFVKSKRERPREELFINESSDLYDELQHVTSDTPYTVVNQNVIDNFESVILSANVDTDIKFGNNESTNRFVHDCISQYNEYENDNVHYKTVGIVFNFPGEVTSYNISGTWDDSTQTTVVTISKYGTSGTSLRIKDVTFPFNYPEYEANSIQLSSYTAESLYTIYTDLVDNPADILNVTFANNVVKKFTYSIHQYSEDNMSVEFSADTANEGYTFGINLSLYKYDSTSEWNKSASMNKNYLQSSNIYESGDTSTPDVYRVKTKAMTSHRDKVDSTFFTVTNSGSVGFTYNSTSHEWETPVLAVGDTIVSEFTVNDMPENYYRATSAWCRFDMYSFSKDMKVWVDGELVHQESWGDDYAAEDHRKLSYGSVVKVEATVKYVSSSSSPKITFEHQYDYESEDQTGTQQGFEDNLKEAIKNYYGDETNSWSTKRNMVAIAVDIPDLNNTDYTTIIGKTLIQNYESTPSTDPNEQDIDILKLYSYPYLNEVNGNLEYLYIECKYDKNYSEVTTLTTIQTNGVINTAQIYDELWTHSTNLDTINIKLFGLVQNGWAEYSNYTLLTTSFNTMEITNVKAPYTIKLTIESQSLSDPLVTTLAPGQSMTLADVGITYDSIKAEWNDSFVDLPLSTIENSLYIKWTP